MTIPCRSEAISMLKEASKMNPGPWVKHAYYVGEAAHYLAEKLGLDSEKAYVLGLLHDIGRRAGVYGMRHSYDGYKYLKSQGYEDAARICLTHVAFTYLNEIIIVGQWDGTKAMYDEVKTLLEGYVEDDYDRLIKLCDYISLPSGFTIIEKRLVDMTLRSGFNEYTLPRWQSTFEIKDDFEKRLGHNIYKLLPGIKENLLT